MFNGKRIVAAVAAFILFFVVMALLPWTTVEAGSRGVVLEFGAFNGKVLDPGFHFLVPFRDRVVEINVQTNKVDGEALAYSKDGQTVNVSLVLAYSLVPVQAGSLYRDIGLAYEDKIIKPLIGDAIKQVMARYTADELLINRGKVRDEAKESIRARLDAEYFTVVDLNLTNFDFDDQYEAAIAAKQVAEQEAKRQENITKSEEEKKKQEILKAEALAEKTRLEAVALNNQASAENLIKKIQAEATLEAAKRWNGVLPTQMIPNGALPFINVK
jgi:regulator of protease activity HflC (stomatin/prohibitin superfamily)